MANTVAYNNSTNPVGSIKKGVVSINIDNSLITSGLTWRNGIEFTNQYIIYSDTYTQGIDTQQNAKPCAWSCDYNDTALRDLINSLPPLIGQPKYNTLSDAIAWLEGQNKYFLVNQNYPEIVTSGCVLNMDAGMSGSYPNAQTTWYDISGNLNNSILTNGPTWVSSGISSSFLFDGTDDYAKITNSSSLNMGNKSFTGEIWIKIPNSVGGERMIFEYNIWGNTGTYQLSMITGSIIRVNWPETYVNTKFIDYNYPPITQNVWTQLVPQYDKDNDLINLYINGSLVSQITGATYDLGNVTSSMYIMSRGGTQLFLPGNLHCFRMYNRALSQSEILQNYYKGKIVTSGLTLALDAGNLVSYSGAGTTWYDMTPNGNNGTLTNGPTYSGGTVPSISFDGTDDYGIIPYNSAWNYNNNITLEAWVMVTSNTSGYQGIFGPFSNSPAYNGFNFSVSAGSGKLAFLVGGSNSSAYYVQQNTPYTLNTWYHLVGVINNGTSRLYVNGVRQSDSTTMTVSSAVGPFMMGRFYDNTNDFYFGGRISNGRFYNRVLSESEISQNFNTYRRRFGI